MQDYRDFTWWYHETGEALHAPPVPDAVESLDFLISRNLPPRIVSTKPDRWAYLVTGWFQQHGLDLPVYTANSGSKAPYVRGLHLFVDDDPRKLEDLDVPRPVYFSRNGSSDPRFETVASWQETLLKCAETYSPCVRYDTIH